MSRIDSDTARSRRWGQFGLRGVLIAVAILAIVFGWYTTKVTRQKRAVAAIRQLGGSVQYDFDESAFGSEGLDGSARVSPFWLRQLLGDDFFGNVIAVRIESKDMTDANLACLKDLIHLRSLYLQSPQITGAGLAHLNELDELEVLVIGCPITEDSVEPLKSLHKLRRLSLAGERFSTKGMEQLTTAMPNCFVFFW